MFCKWCKEGNEPAVLDIDGVLSSVSGTPGCWGHSYEDDWWPCQRKAAEEHAIIANLQVTKDGKRICNGMTVFERDAMGNVWRARVEISITATNRPWIVCGPVTDDLDPTECWGTKEAAESAGQEARG